MHKKLFARVRRIDVIFIGLLFTLIFLFWHRLFLQKTHIISTAEIGVSDIWDFNFPLKNFLHETLRQNQLPLWNKDMGGGFPVFAEGQVGALNLMNLILFKFLPTIYAFNLGIVLLFFQAALGMYLFTRSNQFSPLTAFFCASIFTLSGFWVTHVSHFVLLQSAAYFPWIILAGDLLIVTPNIATSLFLAFLISQQIFAGFPQMTFITACTLLLYFIFKLLRLKSRFHRIFFLVFGVGWGIVLSFAQILPTWELLQISNRATNNISETLRYTFPPVHILSFVAPFIFGNPQIGSYPHFAKFMGSLFWENSGYLGILPLIFCVISLKNIKRNQQIFFYFGLLIISMLLMFGGAGPLYFLQTIPPFSLFRFPSRFILVFIFALVILAGYGIEIFLTQLKLVTTQQRMNNLKIWITILAISNVFWIWYPYHSYISFETFQSLPETAIFLKNQSPGNIYSYKKNVRAFNEFFKHGSQVPQNYTAYRNELVPNLNLLYDVTTVDSYAAMIPKRIALYNGLMESGLKISKQVDQLSQAQERFLSLRNGTYILSPVPLQHKEFTPLTVIYLSTADPLYVYRNEDALPKQYVVNQTHIVETYEDFVQTFFAENFDIKNTVLIEQKIGELQTSQPLISHIETLSESHMQTTLKTQTNQNTVLSLSTSYYPGWQGYIDGKLTQVFPVNFINSGVYLPFGNHIVKMIYDPHSFKIGLIITLMSYSLTLLYLTYTFLSKFR